MQFDIDHPFVYLSGPMTGLPEYNRPAFFQASARLRKEFPEAFVHNPARINLPLNATWADYMRLNLHRLTYATEIRLLPGWEASSGARIETLIGALLDMPIRTVEGQAVAKAKVLDEAIRFLEMERAKLPIEVSEGEQLVWDFDTKDVPKDRLSALQEMVRASEALGLYDREDELFAEAVKRSK